jgi:hypothetical protein
MAQYIIVYLGGEQPANAEEGQQHMEKYREWLSSLGDAVISALNPLKDTHTISSKDYATPGSSTAMSGFTIIEANSLEAVLEMSKSCPFMDIGGTLEVSELMQMG